MRTIADLRASRKLMDEFKNLRLEILDLQKTTRDPSRELDELEEQSEGATPAKAAARGDSKPKKKSKA